MKKNRQSKAFWLTIMRITGMQFFMILFLTSFAWAKTSAQEELNKKISISIDGIVLKSALQKIEKTAQIRISYNSQVVPLNRTVTLLASNERVGDVLERLLKPLSVTYVMFNNQIVLRKIETPSTTTNATETERENVVALPTVSGTITDEKGKALPGVNITIKGTTKGTNSDASGHFKIEVPTENTTLVFSYVGYIKQEVVVGNRTVFNISLALELQSLDEVVVVGYGTQSKRAVSGAVSSVGFKQFQDRSFSNVTQALSGQIAGVNISQSQGAPGVSPIIRIRGVSSITAGTNPLFVVDCVPLENFN